MDFVLAFLLLVMPAYVSNAVPVVLGGGLAFDALFRTRVFGKNKTIWGFFAGMVFGSLAAFLLMLALPMQIRLQYLAFGIVSSFGAMLGDISGSFLKRRIGIAEGKQFFLDQVLFIIVALALGYFVLPEIYGIEVVAAVLIATFFMHIIFNIIANRIGVKNVPW